MRILPRVNPLLNEDWITDKIRFSYDSFRSQRLFDPMVKLNNSFFKVSWKKAFSFAKNTLLTLSAVNNAGLVPLKTFLGERVDLETTYIIKKFLNLSGSNFVNFSSSKNFNDFPFNYTFNTPLAELVKSDFCVF